MSHVGRNKRTLVVALMLSAGLTACGGEGGVRLRRRQARQSCFREPLLVVPL